MVTLLGIQQLPSLHQAPAFFEAHLDFRLVDEPIHQLGIAGQHRIEDLYRHRRAEVGCSARQTEAMPPSPMSSTRR